MGKDLMGLSGGQVLHTERFDFPEDVNQKNPRGQGEFHWQSVNIADQHLLDRRNTGGNNVVYVYHGQPGGSTRDITRFRMELNENYGAALIYLPVDRFSQQVGMAREWLLSRGYVPKKRLE